MDGSVSAAEAVGFLVKFRDEKQEAPPGRDIIQRSFNHRRRGGLKQW